VSAAQPGSGARIYYSAIFIAILWLKSISTCEYLCISYKVLLGLRLLKLLEVNKRIISVVKSCDIALFYKQALSFCASISITVSSVLKKNVITKIVLHGNVIFP
jgi:hypothetical protein